MEAAPLERTLGKGRPPSDGLVNRTAADNPALHSFTFALSSPAIHRL